MNDHRPGVSPGQNQLSIFRPIYKIVIFLVYTGAKLSEVLPAEWPILIWKMEFGMSVISLNVSSGK